MGTAGWWWEKAGRGGYTALKLVEKLVCTCSGFPLCRFIPVSLDAWGRGASYMWGALIWLARIGNVGTSTSQALRTLWTVKQGFSSLVWNLGGHMQTLASLAFWGKKKKKVKIKIMTSSLYLPQISYGERRRVYKCQLSKINGSHRKTNVRNETWLTESLLCIKCMCCSDRRISLLPPS